MKKVFNMVAGLILAVFILSAAVVMTIDTRSLYRSVSGSIRQSEYDLSMETIDENYGILMDYLKDKDIHRLEFKELPQSREGRIHFEEVKAIFLRFITFFRITAVLLLLCVAFSIMNRDFRFIDIGSAMTVIIPVLVGIPALVDFSWAFTLFHRLAFSNDYWMFDPAKDPIIDYLPEKLFFYNAMMIIALIILGIVLFQLLKKFLERRFRKDTN